MKQFLLLFLLQTGYIITLSQNQKATQTQLLYGNSAILPLSAGGVLPRHLDISDKFPPPGDQCTTNSCASFACTYNLLTYLNLRDHNLPFNYVKNNVLNKGIIFSPFFSFFYNKDSKNCSTCTSKVYETLDSLLEQGVPFLSEFEVIPCSPENCEIKPSPGATMSALKNRLKNFAWIYSSQVTSKMSGSALIKRFLYSKIPVVVILDINNDFKDLGKVDSNFVYSTDYEMNLNDHSMICTGYDEDRGALKFINSYAHWGDNGRIWISTKVVDKHLQEAYVANVNKNILVKGYVRYVLPSGDSMGLNSSERLSIKLTEGDFKAIDDLFISVNKISKDVVGLKIIQKGADGLDYIDTLMVKNNYFKDYFTNSKKVKIALSEIANKNLFGGFEYQVILKDH